MFVYLIISATLTILICVISYIYSSAFYMKLHKWYYFNNHDRYFEINKIYLYDCGNALNTECFHEYYMVKNKEMKVVTLNQDMIYFDFKVGDKFILTGPNTIEINIREEDLDKVLIYSIVKNTDSATLEFEKRFSNMINNKIKKSIMQSNK